MNPRWPIYIVSKGRAKTRLTMRSLDEINVPYFVVVEAQERDEYAAVIDAAKILVLDPKFQVEYDAFDDLGMTKSKGAGPARNFAWDHALKSGAEYHWVMDDNINHFWRHHCNSKIRVSDGTIFRCMEDFVARYSNVAMAGPQYYMFCSRKSKLPPYVVNTRIYSCNLIRNDVPFRWRGRYNEDTDLSLRMLKAKWCTVQFNAFLQWKVTTQHMRGGNTKEFYAKEGTLPKSQMLARMHPDVAEVTFKWGRWHHHVDYRAFQRNRLVLRDGVAISPGVDDYGMQLVAIR